MLNDKYKLVRSKTAGVDPRVDELLDSLDSPLGKLYSTSESLYKSPLKKGYIEAALLCDSNLSEVAKILEIPLEVVQVYQEFFFDTVGWDRLSKVEHIESVQEDNMNEAMLKTYALGQGLPFLAWRLGHKVSISPVEGLSSLFSTCMYKATEAAYNSSSTEASKEAAKWAKQSTDIARLLKMWVMDNSGAKSDLVIAIKEVVPDFDGMDSLLDELSLLELTSSMAPK